MMHHHHHYHRRPPPHVHQSVSLSLTPVAEERTQVKNREKRESPPLPTFRWFKQHHQGCTSFSF